MTLPTASGSGVAVIVAKLKAAIVDGTYEHGERLPAERDLASYFNASRTTVREALRQLEERTLVSRRVGSGTFVIQPQAASAGNIAEITSPLELMEVREAIEPHLVRLAVAHAAAKDLEILEKALEELEASGDEQEPFSAADEKFHMALAAATGNPLMIWIYGQINQIRCHDQWHAMKSKVLNKPAIRVYNQQHRAMVEAIRSRDVEEATAVVRQHLDKAREDLIGMSPRVLPNR
ncbi:MAG: FadR/GntR family transcriptional regulator [Geminicoccaceae bacterium]